MADRIRPIVVIQIRRDPAGLHAARFREKLVHRIRGVARFIGSNRHFHAIASGKDHSFHHARPLAQAVERFRQSPLLISQLLAHLDRRGMMTQACDQQLHGISVGLSPACATHVSAPQPSTTRAIKAALRPRQPADARMKIIARHNPQVTNDSEMLAFPTQLVPSSIYAHITPKITPRVMKTKPKPIEVLIRSSSVPKGGSFSSSEGLFLLLSRRSWIR